ncbi:MAG TPA: hypothetical protein VGC80_05255, partial [Acetobacteraceae bacterium]
PGSRDVGVGLHRLRRTIRHARAPRGRRDGDDRLVEALRKQLIYVERNFRAFAGRGNPAFFAVVRCGCAIKRRTSQAAGRHAFRL